MVLSPNGYRPQQWRLDSLRPVSLKAEGYELFQLMSADGDTKFVAPALNFLPLISQRSDGYRQAFTNINVRDQAPELFAPPADVTITECPQPMGIVFSQPGVGPPQAEHYGPCGMAPAPPKPIEMR
jgi:hypothetical protein